MKDIATNNASFPRLIQDGCVYVDKTDLLLKLISSTDRCVFISRPRRFGKSLMLSTLKAIFEGRRELFADCAIDKSNYDWKTYPVMMLDMSDAKSATYEGMKLGLNRVVIKAAESLSLHVEINDDPAQTFLSLWNAIQKKGLQVVVLVDEYDVPLQGFSNDAEEFEKIRQLLHDFYIRFKSHAENIRFLMLTGVTKIAKLSILSGLNSPTDITFDKEYASLLGYTHEEAEKYFREHIDAFAETLNTTHSEIFGRLLEWYDYYRFSAESKMCVLNPVSMGYALRRQLFENYWMETGQTSMVVERLKAVGKLPIELDNLDADKSQLSAAETNCRSIKALLYQAGYLTIKDVNEYNSLILGIPNYEVRETLSKEYLQTIVGDDSVSTIYAAQRAVDVELSRGNLEKVLQAFYSAIAAFPYEWLAQGKEGAAKVAFISFFSSLRNVTIHPERQITNGRIDAIVETKDAVYIFEFKYDRSAQEAFDQILEKGYHKPYLASGKKVFGIGLNFNPAENVRGMDEAVVQNLDSCN